MIIAVGLIVLGLVVGLALSRALLGGLLRMMIREARGMVRRLRQRRSAVRADSADRRHADRRAHV